ncbi:MAG: exosortase C-terminal domain/associated protein EpsI [Chthonomonadales bacterium]
MQPFIKLSALFAAAAAVSIFMDVRLQHAGDWMPSIPAELGVWSAREKQLSRMELETLGYPKYVARDYSNPAGDVVSMSVLAASSMNTYHDPRSCSLGNGYTLTGERIITLPGTPIRVRAMVLRNGDTRAIMYYWLQNSDGTSNTEGAIRHDILARLASVRTIFSTVALGRKTCVIRVFTLVKPSDDFAIRARRNVAFISREIYKALRSAP